MKENELMIGDLLMAYHDDGETQRYFPVIVDGIDKNGTLVDGNCYISWTPLRKENCKEEYADELSPIPLTSEILEKNEFVRGNISKMKWYLGERGYGQMCLGIFDKHFYLTHCVQFESDDFESFDMPEIAIPTPEGINVHILQHALRLCGLNDLADNFQV